MRVKNSSSEKIVLNVSLWTFRSALTALMGIIMHANVRYLYDI